MTARYCRSSDFFFCFIEVAKHQFEPCRRKRLPIKGAWGELERVGKRTDQSNAVNKLAGTITKHGGWSAQFL
jgi:hypothetical protein